DILPRRMYKQFCSDVPFHTSSESLDLSIFRQRFVWTKRRTNRRFEFLQPDRDCRPEPLKNPCPDKPPRTHRLVAPRNELAEFRGSDQEISLRSLEEDGVDAFLRKPVGSLLETCHPR